VYWCEQRLSHVSRKWWLTWIGPEVPHFNSKGDKYIVDVLFVIIYIFFVILRYAGYLYNTNYMFTWVNTVTHEDLWN
jgi:hypothetical protein